MEEKLKIKERTLNYIIEHSKIKDKDLFMAIQLEKQNRFQDFKKMWLKDDPNISETELILNFMAMEISRLEIRVAELENINKKTK